MTTRIDSATAAKRPQLLKVSDVAQLLNVNHERFTKWLRRIASLIASRQAQIFFALISKKSWSGHGENN
jgi:phage antirepressor YoqD-like protein